MKYRLGIDVGSTHTDAVIIDENANIISATKTMTTPDVTTGIIEALRKVLEISEIPRESITSVMFGTTHVLNAIVQRKGLGKVGVIRIGLPATLAVEPMLDWPSDLREAVNGGIAMIKGGHEYTGEEIEKLDEESLRKAIKSFAEKGVEALAVSSVFSIVNPEHEIKAREIAREVSPNLPVVLSHEIATIGLLERENATILNAATIPVMKRVISSLRKAMNNLGLRHAEIYFAQNDGTIASREFVERFPIFTVIAPISNSIRGAYVLTGILNAIVVDTGGTTSNIGALVNGYPREALEIELAGVRTNIRAPDIIAVGLGGGSIVRINNGDVEVGPVSVGYRLIEEGIAWGGSTLTATDIALGKGVMHIDDPRCNPELVRQRIPMELINKIYSYMVAKLKEYIDKIKTRPDPETVILVGGGSAMWPRQLKGAREVIRPAAAQYANAVGAATALIGATVEKAFSYDNVKREEAINITREEAERKAVEAGADPLTLQLAEVEEVAMPYLPGNAVKIRVKVIGKLRLG